MTIAAVRYANPGLIPANVPQIAAVAYPTGARVDGGTALVPAQLYLPTEAIPSGLRQYGAIQYLPGDAIPTSMRRVVLTRASALAYSVAVLADSPVGYWRLDEASGTTSADSSGNTNTGTYTGGVTLGQAGALAAEPDGTGSTAVLLNGTSGYVAVPASGSLNVGDTLTFEAWVYPTSFAAEVCLVSRGTNGFAVRIRPGGPVRFDKQDASVLSLATANLTLNAWNHVVTTKSGATVHIYQNGVDVTGTVTNATLSNPATALNIGRDSTAASIYVVGQMDEVAVYPTALSAARVLAHYDAALGR